MSIVTIEVRDELLVVDSRLVSDGLGIEHESFMRTIRKYESVIQRRFGTIRFEIGASKMPNGRINPNPEKFAWLTEDQSIFLMTLSRNTDQVVECKANLVEAFKNARQPIQATPKSALEIAEDYLALAQKQVELQRALIQAEAEKQLLEQENEQLAEAVDELFDYSSIIRVAKFNGVSETRFNWRTLKAMSINMGMEIKRVPSPRFEWQNLYSHDVWRVCYPSVRLPETTTLVIRH
jgi:phage regulator Rha-like protein